jgi:hypothetical protein
LATDLSHTWDVTPAETGGLLAVTVTRKTLLTHAGKVSQAVAVTEVVPTEFITNAAALKV